MLQEQKGDRGKSLCPWCFVNGLHAKPDLEPRVVTSTETAIDSRRRFTARSVKPTTDRFNQWPTLPALHLPPIRDATGADDDLVAHPRYESECRNHLCVGAGPASFSCWRRGRLHCGGGPASPAQCVCRCCRTRRSHADDDGTE